MATSWLVGCGTETNSTAAAPAGPPPARVRVEGTDAEPVLQRYVFSGEVRASRYAEFAPSVSGPIREVAVRVGDRVSARDLLFTVDPRVARSSYEAARAAAESVATEQAVAEREAEALRGAGNQAVAGLEVERAVARANALSQSQEARVAELRRARTSLSDHRVRAPFDGQIAEVRVDVGDWVDAGQVAVFLVDDSTLEVHVGVSPELVEVLDEETPVTLRFGERTAPASIAAVVRSLDRESGTLPVRLVAVERPVWLLPGRWVDVEIDIPRTGGVRVPRDALVRSPAGVRVVKAVDDTAALVDVEVLASNPDYALVRPTGQASLTAGDRVVTRGNERLRPGQPLSIEAAEGAEQNGSENGAQNTPESDAERAPTPSSETDSP